MLDGGRECSIGGVRRLLGGQQQIQFALGRLWNHGRGRLPFGDVRRCRRDRWGLREGSLHGSVDVGTWWMGWVEGGEWWNWGGLGKWSWDLQGVGNFEGNSKGEKEGQGGFESDDQSAVGFLSSQTRKLCPPCWTFLTSHTYRFGSAYISYFLQLDFTVLTEKCCRP